MKNNEKELRKMTRDLERCMRRLRGRRGEGNGRQNQEREKCPGQSHERDEDNGIDDE